MNSNHKAKHLASASMLPIANVSRRGLLKGVGAGALVLAVAPSLAWAEEAKKYGGEGMPNGIRDDVRLFVAIGEDGTVTITNHRAEMGQGIRTGIALTIGDELEAAWPKIKVVQAVGNEAKYGNQDTDGSRSTRQHFMVWRRMGATARTMLEQAAANQWKVPVSECKAVNHEVVHEPTKRKLGYGALANAAAELPVPAKERVKLKSPAQFKYIGTGKVPLYDNMDITTGHTTYGQDVRMDGMYFAVVARPPVMGGTVESFNDSAALKVPGVVKVVKIDAVPLPALFHPQGGVAVVAKNTWAALRGRDALKIVWNDGEHKVYNSDTYKQALQTACRTDGKVVRNVGDAAKALEGAAKKFQAEYYVPILAHAPMEPPAATAVVKDGKAECWACVQGPQAAVNMVAGRLKLAPENVTVHQTLLGGGFGRKSKPDFVVEAALLSQAMDGAPVKVVFTREDDVQHDYYHAVSHSHIEAGMDASGKVVAWRHRTAAPSIFALFGPDPKHLQDLERGMGLVDVPFDIPNIRVENPEAPAHTRIGWFRAVYNVPHAFAVQSFIAELADAAGKDQKDFLLEVIGPPRKLNNHTDLVDSWNYGEDPAKYPYDTARIRNVIELAAKGAGWGKPMPKGEGLGIAAHRSFASYTAVVVHAKVKDGVLSIPRVDIAFDCGPMNNPDRVKQMMQGSVVMGIALATLGEITFKNGAVQQGNFDSFQVTRMSGAPRVIEVHHALSHDWNAPMGGAGEPSLPPVAPALTNAIFNATGKRIRELPIKNQLA